MGRYLILGLIWEASLKGIRFPILAIEENQCSAALKQQWSFRDKAEKRYPLLLFQRLALRGHQIFTSKKHFWSSPENHFLLNETADFFIEYIEHWGMRMRNMKCKLQILRWFQGKWIWQNNSLLSQPLKYIIF